jgi:cell division cycle 14
LKTAPLTSQVLLRNAQGHKVPVHFFNIDKELVYWNFFLDFGPLNLGQLYRFCTKLNAKLEYMRAQETNKNDNNNNNDTDTGDAKVICFYSAPTQAHRANAIYLICAWQVLHLSRTPAQAFHGFSFANDHQEFDTTEKDHGQTLSMPPKAPLTSIGKATVGPLLPFHDASPCACTYALNLMHCLQGLQKARRYNFFNWDTFNVDEYEHFEQVEVCHIMLSCHHVGYLHSSHAMRL